MHPSTDSPYVADAKSASALQHFFSRVRDWLHGEAVKDRADLLAFLDRNAALVAQKCAIDYCRGKAGTFSQSLFREKPFIEALTRCRWESYAAMLADLTLIAETKLIEAARKLGREKDLKPALAKLYADTLRAQPVPAHRQDWEDAIAAFGRRQAAFNPAPAPPPDHIIMHGARVLFETSPIHTNMRKFDEEIVFGAVRFHSVAFSQRLGAQLRPDAVAQSLLSGA
jgi:hypothetical protein